MEGDVGPAVLDLPTVGRLRGLPGRRGSLFDDLTPVFVRTTCAQLGRLGSCLGAGDLVAAASVAQELSQVCAGFGATRAATALASLVTVLQRADADALVGFAANLVRAELDAVLAVLAADEVEPAA